MDKRSQRRLTSQISGRIPGPVLVPFLLLWCLGSFALGQELARLPLAVLAAAVVHPLQSALQAQGALAHGAPVVPVTHTRQVATGLVGSKPPAAPVHKTRGKNAHANMKQSSRVRWATRSNLDGSAASRHGMAGVKAISYRGQVFVAAMPGASRHWGSQVSWTEQRVWTVAVGWNPQLAGGAPLNWLSFGHAADAWSATPCSPMTTDGALVAHA